MTWDIATARARIGLPPGDISKDPQLTQAMAAAMALAESYTDRGLIEKAETLQYADMHTRRLLLRRYPVSALTSITDNDTGAVLDPLTYTLQKETGVVHGGFASRYLTVAWTGGYPSAMLPADLEFALWATFDAVWYATPGWGATAGQSSGGAGTVKAFTINGVRMEYVTDGASSGGGDAIDAYGVIPLTAVAVLDRYRWHSVIGAG